MTNRTLKVSLSSLYSIYRPSQDIPLLFGLLISNQIVLLFIFFKFDFPKRMFASAEIFFFLITCVEYPGASFDLCVRKP